LLEIEIPQSPLPDSQIEETNDRKQTSVIAPGLSGTQKASELILPNTPTTLQTPSVAFSSQQQGPNPLRLS